MALTFSEQGPTAEPSTSAVSSYTYTFSSTPTSGAALIAAFNAFGTSPTSVDTPSGWTLDHSTSEVRGGLVYSKVSDGTETSVTFTMNGGTAVCNARVYSITGGRSSPFDGTDAAHSITIATSYTAPALTPSYADCMSVIVFAPERRSWWEDGDTPPSGYTFSSWTTTASSANPGVIAGWQQLSGTSTQTPAAWTTTDTGTRGVIAHYLIAPAVKSRLLPLPMRFL